MKTTNGTIRNSGAFPRWLLFITLCAGLALFSAGAYAKKPDKPGNGNGGGNSGGGGSSGGIELGVASALTPDKYHLSSVNLNDDIRIVGPVVMVVDGDFDIGNKTIDIAPTGSLEIYVGGNITVNGKGGINNTNVPSKLIVYGTHPEKDPATENPDYSITLSGNGYFSGVLYAPNAEYRTNGGGNSGATLGSVVAMDIRFNGSPGPFHYDEALEDLNTPFGGYRLLEYELKANGNYAVSTGAQGVFGGSNYKTLLASLFQQP